MIIPNTPEYLQEEVFNQYGAMIPLEDIYAYLESNPYLCPESLFLLFQSYETQE